MCKPRSVVIARRCQKDLGLMLKPSERLAVNYTVTVSLKAGADIALLFFPASAIRIAGESSSRGKYFLFIFFGNNANSVRKKSPLYA